MSQTQAQLITSVLEDLNAIGIGESVASADTTLITTRYTTAVADLDKRRIYTVADTNAIADEAFPHLVRIVAELCAPSFGRETKVDLITASETALAELTRFSRSSSYATTTAEVLDRLAAIDKLNPAIDATVVVARTTEVLASLAARRIITFANEAAITPAARPHVALLVAEACAQGSFPPPELALAESTLLVIDRRAISVTTLSREVVDRLDAAGKLVPAIDAAVITARAAEVLADLAARRIATFADEAAVTAAARPHVALLVAEACVQGAFPPPELAAAEGALLVADRLSRASSYSTLVAEVLDRLAAVGKLTPAIDATVITARANEVLPSLAARRIITFAGEGSITAAARSHIAILVAAACADGAFPADMLVAAEAQLLLIDRRTTTTTTTGREVLDRLDAAGKLVPAIDASVIAARTTEVLADLSARRVVTIANEAAVSAATRSHVALLVAAKCADGAVPPAMLEEAVAALAAVARYAATGLTKSVLEQLETWGGGTLTVDAALVTSRIQGWLDDLAGRGILTVTEEADVPSAAMPHLIRWAAAQLAPKPSLDVMELAERRMREQTRRGYRPPPLAFEPVLKQRTVGGTYGW